MDISVVSVFAGMNILSMPPEGLVQELRTCPGEELLVHRLYIVNITR